MNLLPITHRRISKISGAQHKETEDALAVEEPLEIALRHGGPNKPIEQVVSITMRTPGNDEELALGFLFTEGIITQLGQVKEKKGIGNSFLVTLHEHVTPVLHKVDRNFYTTSSCGVCGKTSIDAIQTVSVYKDSPNNIVVCANLLYQLGAVLRSKQDVFKQTGGLHSVALFELDGTIEFLREDVGRHNALDKIIGAAFLQGRLPLDNKILLLSGRASFELIQKATMAGIRLVVAVGAPSNLAVQLAEEAGITLVGFLKDNSFNLYTGHHRINVGS